MVESVKPTRESPSTPGIGAGLSANVPNPSLRPEPSVVAPRLTIPRGAPMHMAKNMDALLSVPTATSVRSVPMKLAIDQCTGINNSLKTSKDGKVSFTHLIAYAMIQALKAVLATSNSYDVINGKPTPIENPAINLGTAIDLKKPDGTR